MKARHGKLVGLIYRRPLGCPEGDNRFLWHLLFKYVETVRLFILIVYTIN